jgi:hypothetical protein
VVLTDDGGEFGAAVFAIEGFCHGSILAWICWCWLGLVFVVGVNIAGCAVQEVGF